MSNSIIFTELFKLQKHFFCVGSGPKQVSIICFEEVVQIDIIDICVFSYQCSYWKDLYDCRPIDYRKPNWFKKKNNLKSILYPLCTSEILHIELLVCQAPDFVSVRCPCSFAWLVLHLKLIEFYACL